MKSRKMQIAVACINASGLAALPVFTVEATDDDVAQGIHYEQATELAQQAGYGRPFLCFDETEQAAIHTAAQELNG